MVNPKLEAALAYSRMRWRIFPCHSIVPSAAGAACSCGKAACSSPGKHPRTRGGFKDATDDEAQIRHWWTRWPDANIALATGSGLAVIDIDGEEGFREFQALVAAHDPLPPTLVQATGRGHHLIFRTRPDSPEVRSSARGNVHVRGEGGYIILTPSDHVSGRKYQWVKSVAVAILPEWLRQWTQGYEITAKTPSNSFNLGPLPAHLQQQNQRDVTSNASEALKTVWSASEQARLISALSAIPVKSCGYDEYLKIGFALHSLDWERSDGTSIALDIWDEWCKQSEHYNPAGLQEKWRSFGRSARGEVTVATIYHLAHAAGWNGGAPAPSPQPVNGHANGHANGAAVAPLAFGGQQPIFFPDMTEEGKVRSTMLNAKVAIQALGVECRYDKFHNRMLVAGELTSQWHAPELSDPIITVLRDHIRYRFAFDPGKQQVQDAAETLCLNRMFDPVLDYLDGLQWDGIARLDSWLAKYLGVVDSEYSRAVARLSLIAAVRRARHPGTKFDQIIVLEGKQGAGKSEAIRILAGPENFSDQKILGVDERKQQELTEGVWLYEIAELTGLRRAEIEHVKAFVSRTTDRARPAYGRYMIHQPRRTVFFGSTNPGQPYLQDDTGNRRFWPVLVGRIDLDGLRRDRDQLWAEASAAEARGASHMLPERLWQAAAEEQDRRTEVDEWTVPIGNYIAQKGTHEFGIMDVLVDNQFLRLEAKDVGQAQQNRAARVLRGLGFERFRDVADEKGRRPWKYRRKEA